MQSFLKVPIWPVLTCLKFDVPMLVEEFLRADVEFDYSRKRIVDAQRIYHLMEKAKPGSRFQILL
jgi:DNA polymerase-3 subunit epsilon